MVGRIPVMDVMPVVDLGRRPAKATLGEPFPVRATVFREGHDLLGAEVVLDRGPTARSAAPGADGARGRDPRPLRRRWLEPTRVGPLRLRGPLLVGPPRHLAARRRR